MDRLLIDYSAGYSQGAGIGRYARNVVPAALASLPDWPVTLAYAAGGRQAESHQAEAMAPFAGRANVRTRRIPIPRRRLDLLWFRMGFPLPIQAFAGRCGVIYSPDFTAPPALGRHPRIITVHDLAFLVAPAFAPPGLRRFLASVVPGQVATAHTVAAVSETTRNDVIERLGIDPGRVEVIPNGVEERFFSAMPPTADMRARLGLPEAYLLVVGTLEPRKNHLTLFRAVEQCAREIGLPLVVAGRRGWADDEIVAEMVRLADRGLVVPVNYVPDADLPALYAGAATVIYPSWYEGFGLPVIEAMAAGVPVVASTAPALVEVGGETVQYVEPSNADALAHAIEISMGERARSADAVHRRVERAQTFAWSTSGARLAAVLRAAEDGR